MLDDDELIFRILIQSKRGLSLKCFDRQRLLLTLSHTACVAVESAKRYVKSSAYVVWVRLFLSFESDVLLFSFL